MEAGAALQPCAAGNRNGPPGAVRDARGKAFFSQNWPPALRAVECCAGSKKEVRVSGLKTKSKNVGEKSCAKGNRESRRLPLKKLSSEPRSPRQGRTHPSPRLSWRIPGAPGRLSWTPPRRHVCAGHRRPKDRRESPLWRRRRPRPSPAVGDPAVCGASSQGGGEDSKRPRAPAVPSFPSWPPLPGPAGPDRPLLLRPWLPFLLAAGVRLLAWPHTRTPEVRPAPRTQPCREVTGQLRPGPRLTPKPALRSQAGRAPPGAGGARVSPQPTAPGAAREA